MPPVFTEQSLLEKYASKISRTGYFFAAVLLHLIVGLLVATVIIFPSIVTPPDLTPKAFLVPTKPVTPTPPPTDPKIPATDTGSALPDVPNVIKGNNSSFNFDPKIPGLSTPTQDPHIIIDPGPAHTTLPHNGPSPGRVKEWKKSIDRYRPLGNIVLATQDIRNLEVMLFPVYLAAYADGDWGCNVSLDGKGEILAGSLPNLVEKIKEWSHGKIPGKVIPQPLNIGSPELLDKRPPFIFFTGHKDFHLTDVEVKNLAEYLYEGGCIWGDNALPGKGSRFDVAFRREMKRVVPDVDKDFQPVALDDPIYTKSWFPKMELPPGMNYYTERMERFDIDKKLAILYTPNDYSDMFSMRILPGDKTIVGGSPVRKSDSPLFTNGLFLYNRQLFFRNFDLDPCLQSDKLGMNIVVHLLTRFDDILQFEQ